MKEVNFTALTIWDESPITPALSIFKEGWVQELQMELLYLGCILNLWL